jgi:hypothetical protein
MKAQALAAAAALALPAAAQAAPTITADLPCYFPGQPLALTGSGFTPNVDVSLMMQLAGGRGNNLVAPKDPLRTDGAGGLLGRFAAPDLASDNDLRETVTLTASDPAGPAATQFLLTNVGVRVGPWLNGRGAPRGLTTFKIVGWEPYHKVYAHYFLKGKRLKTVEVGSVTGPCGDLTKKMRQFPFRPVPAGTYTVRFTGTRFYDPQGWFVYYKNVVVPKAKAVR